MKEKFVSSASNNCFIPFVPTYSKLITSSFRQGAYDNRCGTIQTFPSKEDAHLANYSVAHCKRCAHCSTWQDLKVQWTTRLEAAKLAQACG